MPPHIFCASLLAPSSHCHVLQQVVYLTLAMLCTASSLGCSPAPAAVDFVRRCCHLPWTDQAAPPGPTQACLFSSQWVIWHDRTPPTGDKRHSSLASSVPAFLKSNLLRSSICCDWLTVYLLQRSFTIRPRSTCRCLRSGTIAHMQT